jgi:glycosyltransferase involved in cell wall biosynthesis
MAERTVCAPLRVLVAHNAYRQQGGEDAVVDAEVALLRRHGHEVTEYRRHNDEMEWQARWSVAAQTMWSMRTVRDVADLLGTRQIDVIHCHNTFPLISPSIYWAAHRAKVPVVQTLHNFRFLCPQAMFLREGQVCEDCLGHLPWRAVTRACYRSSRLQSAVLCGTLAGHRVLGTYRDKITLCIALNEFCRRKFIEGGLPAGRVRVKPNFIDTPAPRPIGPRHGFLFAGRLSPEKGVGVLIEAARLSPGLTLRVAGGGPDERLLHEVSGLVWLGKLSGERVLDEMAHALSLVVPSLWYENFPRTIVEAFASGLPVIGSRLGAMEELIEHGVTGLLFEPGNAEALAETLRWADAHPAEMETMGRHARERYEQHLSGDSNYEQLISIYREAVALRAAEGNER